MDKMDAQLTLSAYQPGVSPQAFRSARSHTIQERFDEWLDSADGQTVYAEVVERALALRSRGFTHFGIGAIWESIRYDHSVRVGPDDGFKLNDHYRSRLARLVMDEYPLLEGFFETRKLTS